MGELLGKRRLVDRIIGLGVVTVAAGLFLYWHDWHLFQSFGDWLGSRFGGSLTIGMVSALIALGIGGSITRPNVRRLLALGAQVAASGAPPTPDVTAELATIQRRLKIFSRVALGLLLFAVVTMSVARYL
jgi:hypothetical protein